MTEQENHQAKRRVWPFWAGAITVVGAAFAWVTMPPLEVMRCEERIKAQLAAPSTYSRVGWSGGGNVAWSISFDAQNGFGAPIRSTASCRVIDGEITYASIDAPGYGQAVP